MVALSQIGLQDSVLDLHTGLQDPSWDALRANWTVVMLRDFAGTVAPLRPHQHSLVDQLVLHLRDIPRRAQLSSHT